MKKIGLFVLVMLVFAQINSEAALDNMRPSCHMTSQEIVKKLLETPGINPHHVNKKGETAIALLNKIARY